jgi:carboxyl-terminal processing protease
VPLLAGDSSTVHLAERVFIASKIYAAVHVYFAHWEDVPDLDLDSAYQHYLSQILVSDNQRRFDLATLEFMARLKNGHSWFHGSLAHRALWTAALFSR